MSLLRIVLTEDEEIITIIIQNQLGAEYWQITVCAEAVIPWKRLQADRPGSGFNCVLLDRGLLNLDGMDLLCRTKNDPARAGALIQQTPPLYVL